MKPVTMAILAVMFYAISNVIMEQRLSKMNNLVVLLISLPIMWTLTLITYSLKGSGDSTISFWPPRELWWFVGINAAIWFVADYNYVGAYTGGGSLMTITTIVVMFPVVAAVFKLIWSGQPPNMYHLLGWAVAALAVWLIIKGETISTPRGPL